MKDDRSDGEQHGAAGDTTRASGRRISSQVSIISRPEAHIIRYKWADARVVLAYIFLPVFLFAAFITYVSHNSAASRISPAGYFNPLDHVAITIAALSVGYFVAIITFNKTTTVITDTTFSVRRGPVPCPWPGDHVRAVEDVREISYVPYYTVNPYGFVTYTVFATFKDGKAAKLFFLLFKRGEVESPAVELANQVQAWVDEKKQGRRGASSVPHYPRALATAESPISRAQRRKVVASLLATLVVLAALATTAEYFAGRFRAAAVHTGNIKDNGNYR